jgi:type I restriction enzyme S subunit
MSEIVYKSLALTDLFDVGRGLPKYTKSYADEHKGEYPVYSSKTENDGVFAYIDSYDYDGEFLTWATDGYAGVPAYRKGKFSCTDHCGILILKFGVENVYLPFVRWQVDFSRLRLGYGNQRVKVNQVKNADIKIKIPIDSSGSYDIELQKTLAKVYLDIVDKRQVLIDKGRKLMGISVLLSKDNSINLNEVQLSDIFSSIDRGKSKYTRTYCKEHAGEYPVYSADNGMPLGFMDSYDYDGKYLTISINGIAGKITIFDERFSTNADRVICIPKDNIDIGYIRFVAEPLLRNKSKGRKGDLGKNEFSKLTPKMVAETFVPIPVKADGTFDLEKQKELAAKYEQIETIKKELISKILELTSVVVS